MHFIPCPEQILVSFPLSLSHFHIDDDGLQVQLDAPVDITFILDLDISPPDYFTLTQYQVLALARVVALY